MLATQKAECFQPKDGCVWVKEEGENIAACTRHIARQQVPYSTLVLMLSFGPQGYATDVHPPCLSFSDRGRPLGDLLCSLFPLLEHFTVDNLCMSGGMLSILVSLKHCRVLDVRNQGYMYGWGPSPTVLVLKNLEHVYIDEHPLHTFPWVVRAAAHPTAIIHIKAFSVLSCHASLDHTQDVAGLAQCLHEHKSSFDWPGTLIVKQTPHAGTWLEDLRKVNEVFGNAGVQGVTRLCIGGADFLHVTYDEVQSLAAAAPHVSELEVQELVRDLKPVALKWMLDAWSVKVLTLSASALSLVEELRSMKVNNELVLRESLCVMKVVPDGVSPQPKFYCML